MDQDYVPTESAGGAQIWLERGQATLLNDPWLTAQSGAGFIGRQQELALLQDSFAAAENGRAGLVFVTGETGIGKTRLLDEAARHAVATGALVLRGDASRAEGTPPYLPFLEALGHYIRSADLGLLREHIGDAGPLLAELFPELVGRLGALPDHRPLPAEQSRFRLYEAVGTFLAAIAAWRPLVIVFNDLQWADAASLDLLSHVVKRQRSAHVLILGSYRRHEIERAPALAHVVAELNRLRLLRTLTLRSLSQDEISLLTANYTDQAISPEITHLLYTQSEGNPFFAEELLLGWIESGLFSNTGDRRRLIERLESRLPAGVLDAIEERLTRLDPETLEQLRVAAIIGRTFDAPLLAEVQHQDVTTVEDHLQTAIHARLVQPYRAGIFMFSHEKIRECLYAGVTAARRRQLHAAIGQIVETRSDLEEAPRLAALAFHFARSGDRARGATYSLSAAQLALSTYAAEDAMMHCSIVLELLDPHDRRRGDVLLLLGEAALQAGREREAVTAYTSARDWWIHVGAPLIASRAAHGLGIAFWRLREMSSALLSLEGAITLVANRTVPERVRAETDLATLLGVTLGRHTEGLVHGYRGLEMARKLGDGRLEATASRVVGTLLAHESISPPILRLLERALDLAKTHDDLAEAAECSSILCVAYAWSVDFTRSRRINASQESLAQSTHNPYLLRHVYSWRAFLQACAGEWAEAEQSLAQEQRVIEHFTYTQPHAFLHQVRGRVAYLRGDYESAVQELQLATNSSLESDPARSLGCRGALGLALLATGKDREAREVMAEQEAAILVAGANDPLSTGTTALGTVLVCLSLMAIEMGDTERLARYYPRLLAYQGQHRFFLVDRVLAAIETHQGNWASAEARLTRSAIIAGRENLRPETAFIAMGQADLEMMRGGPDSGARSRHLLGEALLMFEQLGMEGEARRAETRIEALSEQTGTGSQQTVPPRTTNACGLTDREFEVLRLVAAGKSNREIAEDLYLSEKTVANHLTAIFTKTGTNNRAGAAGFALRSGLI